MVNDNQISSTVAISRPDQSNDWPFQQSPKSFGELPQEVWCRVLDRLGGDLSAIRSLTCVSQKFACSVHRIMWPTCRELKIAQSQDSSWSVNNTHHLSSVQLVRFLRFSVLPNARNVCSLVFQSAGPIPQNYVDFIAPNLLISTLQVLELFSSEPTSVVEDEEEDMDITDEDKDAPFCSAVTNVTHLEFGNGFCSPRSITRMMRRFSSTLESVTLRPKTCENAELEESEEFWNALPKCPKLTHFELSSYNFPLAFGHVSAAILAEPSSLTLPDAECVIDDYEPYVQALEQLGNIKKLSLLERETSPNQVLMTWVSDESWNTTLFEILPKIILNQIQQHQGPGPSPLPRNLETLEISPDFKGDLFDWFTLFGDLKVLRLLGSLQNSPYGVDEQGVRRLLSHSINKYLMVHKGGAPEKKTLKVYGLQLWHDISNIDPNTTEEGYKDILQDMLGTFPTYFGPGLARSMIRKVPKDNHWERETSPLYICEDSNIFIEMYW